MSDNIPLLPEKSEAVCADVRNVLRETFRELEHMPPDIDGHGDVTETEFNTNPLIKNLSSESEKIKNQEIELQWQHAKRLARTPLSNIYTLHSPHSTGPAELNREFTLLQRKDLKPSIEYYANCDKTLWVQNILNHSSGDLSVAKKTSTKTTNIQLAIADAYSLQSISLGEVVPRVSPPSIIPPPPPLPPAHIVCSPPQVAFVNFTVGQKYTQCLRLVNTSKKEITLSIRPPSHHSLKIELRSGLTVTSGAAAELNLNFSPTSVRTVEEKLSVRVSVGRSFVIPVRCYIEPPVLEILIPNPSSDLHVSSTMENVQDVLDLGAKLLGDVHRLLSLLICKELHAAFFILSEESWQDCDIEIVKDLKDPTRYGVSNDCFYLFPSTWCASERSSCVCRQGATCYCGAGGGLQGTVSAYLTRACTKVAVFRIISSTALVRTLHVVADALMFNSEHVTIKAQEKNFDICDKSDPYCGYYLHLGTAFPNQNLSMDLQVLNHSPLTYHYCWRTRAWREDLSTGQLIDKLDHLLDEIPVWVRETEGVLTPQSTNLQNVEADSGLELGTQCAVVMLILKDIPKESLPIDHDFVIIDTKTVNEEAIPGVNKSWAREVCSVIYAQVEVRWEVVPIRFILEPPLVRLSCSRSIQILSLPLRVTQLYGVQAIETKFDSTGDMLLLDPKNTVAVILTLPLKQANETQTDVITLTSIGGEWSSSCIIEYRYTSRCLSLDPAMTYLSTRSPSAAVCTKLDLRNNTYKNLNWHAVCYSSEPAPTCSEFCAVIAQNVCRCPILTPLRGNIAHEDTLMLQYSITAPEVEGCYATIIQVKAEDRQPANSAALISYRVMAPHLVLRIQPCQGDCSVCALDSGVTHGVYKGTAVLRPQSLRCGERVCCRLQVWNTTPLETRMIWEESEDDDVAFVKFHPNEFQLEGYSDANVTVVLEARRVCNRQLLVRRALVAHSQPIYLVIDIVITGVEIVVEFPIGGGERTDSFVTMKLIQKEDSREVCSEDMAASINHIFDKEDYKRIIQKHNICECKKKMVYIPPVKRHVPPRGPDDYPPVEIVYTPPLTCVCRCITCRKPILPVQTEPYCLQFYQVPKNTGQSWCSGTKCHCKTDWLSAALRLPLNTQCLQNSAEVRSRTIVLRNEGGVVTRWRAAVRHWSEKTSKVQWSRSPGVSLQCTPATGTLKQDSVEKIKISFRADTWGVYYDQILIQIEHLEPIILDVWVEVIGTPLQFALRPFDHDDMPPVLWMTNSNPERVVHFTNTSQADLLIYPYILKDHEYVQESLPFRLYIRLYDVFPPTCPCVTAFNEDEEQSNQLGSVYEEMLTGVELYLTSDYGVQNSSSYQVKPSELIVKAKEKVQFDIKLLTLPEHTLDGTMLLRIIPTIQKGKGWYRPSPQLQYIQIRTAHRSASIHASCTEVVVAVCALDMPSSDVMRLRKKFYLRNTGDSAILTKLYAPPPWRVSVAPLLCDKHCTSTAFIATDVELLPRSSVEMFVEVSICAKEYWPEEEDTEYPTQQVHTSSLDVYDVDNILLLTMPLTLLIDQPRLYVNPNVLDLGVVSDGHTSKGYFSVSHSSPTATVEVMVTCSDEDFRLFPTNIGLRPGETKCVYVQYIARWRPYISNIRTIIDISYIGAARAWCRAALPLSVSIQRCSERRAKGDYTDDTHFVPDV